jgi:hypothetical protein
MDVMLNQINFRLRIQFYCSIIYPNVNRAFKTFDNYFYTFQLQTFKETINVDIEEETNIV